MATVTNGELNGKLREAPYRQARLLPGTKIRIVHGRLKGTEGVVVRHEHRTGKLNRCTMSVHFLGHELLLDLDFRLFQVIEFA